MVMLAYGVSTGRTLHCMTTGYVVHDLIGSTSLIGHMTAIKLKQVA